MSRNVAVICLDTVRADYFDAYAPRLRERADVVFDECRAASCWSVPSHASMFTGQLPSEHGITTYSPRLDVLTDHETICSDLPDHHTIGVSANVYAGSPYGFDAIFDEFVDVARDHRVPDGLDVTEFIESATEPGIGRYLGVLRAALGHDHPLESLENAVAAQCYQLEQNAFRDRLPTPLDDGAAIVDRVLADRLPETPTPWFLYVNLMEGHEPHRDTWAYDHGRFAIPRGHSTRDLDPADALDPTPEYHRALARYRELYAASIDYLDRRVTRMIDRLQAADGETTVIVTADHGENLGLPADDGHLGHVTSLTEGVLHVPLLVFNPPSNHDWQAVESGRVTHLEFRSLVTALAHDSTPELGERPVVAEVLGITPGNDRLAAADPDYWTRAIRCGYDGGTKYEWDSTGVNFEIVIDSARPCWQDRIHVDDPPPTALTDAFPRPLADARTAAAAPASDETHSARVEQRLDALGYR